MDIKIDKYEKRRFHKDDEIDKKIKALFLFFDYEVSRGNLSLPNQLTLIDDWIMKFIDHELYEVVPMFKTRRAVIVKAIVKEKNDNMSFGDYMVPKLKSLLRRIKKFLINIFRKKK